MTSAPDSLLELAPVMYELTITLPTSVLEVLYCSPLRAIIRSLALNTLWWQRRVEHLTHKSIVTRGGKCTQWAHLCQQLTKNGLVFSLEHEYKNPLLVPFLLEMGIDCLEEQWLVVPLVRANDSSALKLVLPRLSDRARSIIAVVRPSHIDVAISWGHIECLSVLMESGIYDSYLRTSHTLAHAVKMLLARPQVDPSGEEGEALRTAAKYGHVEIYKLIIQDPRTSALHNEEGYYPGLEEAMNGCRTEIVRLILENTDPNSELTWCLEQAVKSGHREIVQVVLDVQRARGTLSSDSNDIFAIRLARRMGREDTLSLILSVPRADGDRTEV